MPKGRAAPLVCSRWTSISDKIIRMRFCFLNVVLQPSNREGFMSAIDVRNQATHDQWDHSNNGNSFKALTFDSLIMPFK